MSGLGLCHFCKEDTLELKSFDNQTPTSQWPHKSGSWISCMNCFAEGPLETTEIEAIDSWESAREK